MAACRTLDWVERPPQGCLLLPTAGSPGWDGTGAELLGAALSCIVPADAQAECGSTTQDPGGEIPHRDCKKLQRAL